ncbi:hypothetical protein [Paenibacillus endoradicis]|uniref:hypothetical protein n=1 Tax=Paenibacillus endoradicis TaxID=2972487 RepID=UPI002158E6B5|nr:hypothetical protein [Paenibacillus endoradicis]MCR8656229.1 hypothetical protein [Paenibacillus endoradicis]
MKNNKTYAIVNPSAIKTIVSMLLIIAIQIYRLIHQKDDVDNLYYFVIALTVFGVLVLIVSVVRTYIMEPREIRINNESIHIRGRIIRAEEIKMIMISINKKQVIGIKPKGKLIVPLSLYYCYMKDQDEGIQDLVNWANEKGIKLEMGSFVRWL